MKFLTASYILFERSDKQLRYYSTTIDGFRQRQVDLYLVPKSSGYRLYL